MLGPETSKSTQQKAHRSGVEYGSIGTTPSTDLLCPEQAKQIYLIYTLNPCVYP
jgi:hypothetical protein